MPEPTLTPLEPERFDYWAAHHLLNRAGFGGTPGQVRALANLGLHAAVDHIISYETIDAPGWPAVAADAFDRDIMRPATDEERAEVRLARQRGDEAALERYRRQRQQAQRADRRQMRRIQAWWLQRMIETPRPLEEKLTLFWHGHFATSYRGIEDSYHMFLQNQTFRAHAKGRFTDLVNAVIRDPAMLRYLNNNRNRKLAPNENLARELMELFTLGEGNAYTERDIREGARALTGYTFEDDAFVFRAAWHDDGVKSILGRRGPFDGEDFVRIILSQRFASEYICLKLYRFFVNDLDEEPDEPTKQFILALAELFRESRYDIETVLRTLFLSAHFYDERNVCAQIKSPIQLIVQAVRSLRTPVRSMTALLNAADLMGQNPFFPPSVKGWDGGRAWINTATMFVRHNTLIYLLTGQRPDAYAWQTDGSTFDAMHLVEHLHEGPGRIDPAVAVPYLVRMNCGPRAHPQRVQTLERFVREHGGRINNDVLIGLLSLISAMPEYQLC